MKLIFSLILILSITFNMANSFQHVNQKGLKNSESSSSQPSQVCFKDGVTDMNGYTSTYSIVSFNGAVPSTNGPVDSNFAEAGYIDLDFVNNQMYTYYSLQTENSPLSEGRIWAFGSNNTQYVVPTINGVEICYSGQLTFDIPSPVKVGYEGDFSIGTFPCETFGVLSNEQTNSSTSQHFLVSKNDCSLVTTVAYNLLGAVGQISTNFYSFIGESNPNDFTLPTVCNSPQPIPTSTHLLKQFNNQLPSSLKTRFI